MELYTCTYSYIFQTALNVCGSAKVGKVIIMENGVEVAIINKIML